MVVACTAIAQAATPRGNMLYEDPTCQNDPSLKHCYVGTVWVARGAKAGTFNAACPSPGRGPKWTDKDAFFKIAKDGSYRFNGYIHVAYDGKAVARPAHLVVSGKFVTPTKTTGTFHLYEPGCKPISYTLTAY